jgi:hypothetical protein
MIDALPRLGPLVSSENGVTPDYYLLKDLRRIAVQAVSIQRNVGCTSSKRPARPRCCVWAWT